MFLDETPSVIRNVGKYKYRWNEWTRHILPFPRHRMYRQYSFSSAGYKFRSIIFFVSLHVNEAALDSEQTASYSAYAFIQKMF